MTQEQIKQKAVEDRLWKIAQIHQRHDTGTQVYEAVMAAFNVGREYEAEALKEGEGWIAVSDLPEKPGWYLVFDNQVWVGYLDGNYVWQGHEGPFENVTHWMNLPTPPKK